MTLDQAVDVPLDTQMVITTELTTMRMLTMTTMMVSSVLGRRKSTRMVNKAMTRMMPISNLVRGPQEVEDRLSS
jgi:hypothetical protein